MKKIERKLNSFCRKTGSKISIMIDMIASDKLSQLVESIPTKGKGVQSNVLP
jgi:hypothetical protein